MWHTASNAMANRTMAEGISIPMERMFDFFSSSKSKGMWIDTFFLDDIIQ